MTRDEKLEAMARVWCRFNGWVPDHRPLVLKATDDLWLRPGGRPTRRFLEEEGEPLWKGHLRGMDAILTAIE